MIGFPTGNDYIIMWNLVSYVFDEPCFVNETGLGALIVRSRAFRTLTKRYFGGGTVEMFSSSRNFHVVQNSFHKR